MGKTFRKNTAQSGIIGLIGVDNIGEDSELN